MTDDRDHNHASDWLAAQFGSDDDPYASTPESADETPDAAAPNAEVPNVKVPDAAVQNAASSEVATPDAETLEVASPDAAVLDPEVLDPEVPDPEVLDPPAPDNAAEPPALTEPSAPTAAISSPELGSHPERGADDDGLIAVEPAGSASSGAAPGAFIWGLTPTNAAATPAAPSSPAVPPSLAVPEHPLAEPAPEIEPAPEPEPRPEPESAPEPEPRPELESASEPWPLPEPPLPPTVAFTPPPLIVPPLTPPVMPPSEPPPFDAALAGGPSIEADPPTMALPWEGPATELFSPPMASASVAEPATELLSGFGPGAADAAAGSSVEALFGESQFREYQTGSLVTASPTVKTAPARAPRAPLPHSQKVLLWIAGGLAALLVLVGLFFLGTKLPRANSVPVAVATPTASASSTPTPSPTPTVLPAGPLAAGSYKWDQLLGGECLDPFTSPWVEKFTVVDCTAPHPAQMVARGVFADTPPAATDPSASATPAAGDAAFDAAAATYPGVEALQAQINLLCTTPSVIDFVAAGAYSDIQILGSYPATAKQWADGNHSYFCFVTRSSGEPITSSLAVPHP